MSDHCPTCGGQKTEGTTTFSADLEFGVVVVRDVPATVCKQCGDDWISPEVARHLDQIVEEAKQKGAQIEMMPYQEPAAM